MTRKRVDPLLLATLTALIIGGTLFMRWRWHLPITAIPYARTIQDAEFTYNLPPLLLARLLYQESRFRNDIITGEYRSPAGAIGIAQIIPRWHPEIGEAGALDPDQAIPYAAKYLRTLYNQFGSWRLALAAYNWGPGNLQKVLDRTNNWMAELPTETHRYVTQISDDVLHEGMT